MRQDSISAGSIHVALRRGLPAAIDDAAARGHPAHAFLRRAWFESAVDDGVHTLLATRGDGSLIAALPTCELGRARIRAVPGSYWPYRSFPIAADADDAELAALLADKAARRALGRVWRLGPVYQDDPTAARLMRAAPSSGWTVLSRRIATSFLLDMDAVQAEGKWPRGSTLRKNRFHEKHLASYGELEWRFVSGASWSREIFDALAAIEQASWVARETNGKDAKFMAPHNRIFWENAARDPLIAEMISAAILYVAGEPAAFSFDLDVGHVKHAIANSYDERFAKHSPGKLLYYRNLVRAMERGIRLVDWGAGDGGYKSTIGAAPGPEIVDLLFVRGGALAALIRPLWERSGRG